VPMLAHPFDYFGIQGNSDAIYMMPIECELLGLCLQQEAYDSFQIASSASLGNEVYPAAELASGGSHFVGGVPRGQLCKLIVHSSHCPVIDCVIRVSRFSDLYVIDRKAHNRKTHQIRDGRSSNIVWTSSLILHKYL